MSSYLEEIKLELEKALDTIKRAEDKIFDSQVKILQVVNVYQLLLSKYNCALRALGRIKDFYPGPFGECVTKDDLDILKGENDK